MKHLLALASCIVFAVFNGQAQGLKGIVTDAETGEPLIGATISTQNGSGVAADLDGFFTLTLEAGTYEITVAYVGYDSMVEKVTITDKMIELSFRLQSKVLDEVVIVADVAKSRETPIAYSNISSKKIQEELGAKDLPMVLNTTPGAYATEQGGGSGDARVTIRGFDQRNVAVLVDGVPVNDMENGQVYWSNWDGLGDITRTMQVQRGLGASKLAIASVGGTINILTKGIDQKRNLSIKQEITDYGLNKTSFGFNSGKLKGGWGITLAGARKWGSNWADATFTDAYSYFIKIQKQFDKHLISLSANGSPQKHGMRYDRLPMAIYDKAFSDKLGINSDSVLSAYNQIERGRTYNPNWGSTTNNVAYMGNPFPDIGNAGQFNDRVNFYHKPQINLSHFWTPSDRWSLSTVAYLSIGKGGGTGLKNTAAKLLDTGQLNVQSIYDGNTMNSPNVLYNATERPSTNYLRSNNNEHFWYGILSTANVKVSDRINAMFGLDARSYKGSHFQTVYDLMGGDYTVDAASNANQVNGTYIGDPNFQNAIRHVGDTIGYHNDSFVKWGGLFGQIEYKKDRITAFLTASVSTTQYQRVDYYKKRDLVINGEVFSQVVGNGDRFFYNGQDYLVATSTNVVNVVNDTTFITAGSNTRYIVNADEYNNKSPESRYASTDVKHFYGNTFKTGASYKINENQNVFMNAGILNMAPRMDVVFDNNNNEIKNTRNQHVYAIEGGYNFHNKKFAANLNAYYTRWDNKPPSSIPQVVTSDGTLYYNITGLNALHKGVELDFIYKFKNKLEIEGLLSWGDWRTTSGSTSNVTDDNGNVVAVIDFSAKNVHVGDAAQIQTAGSLRYEIIKNLYIKGRFTYFDKNYANFDPTLLTSTNKDRESWRMPSYGLLDFFAGYDFTYQKVKFTATGGMSNALDITYLTDAQNGTKFDATTATVFMGMGRRINFSLRISY